MAEKYALAVENCAEEKKTAYASTYISISEQELEYYDRLHRMLIKEIDRHTNDKTVHDAVKRMCEYYRKKRAERIAEIRFMLAETEKF